jgi:hypothetical protein
MRPLLSMPNGATEATCDPKPPWLKHGRREKRRSLQETSSRSARWPLVAFIATQLKALGETFLMRKVEGVVTSR